MFGGDLLESKYRYVKSMEKVTIWRRPIGKQIKRCKNYGKIQCLEETYWKANKEM